MTLREMMNALDAIIAERGPEALDAPVIMLPADEVTEIKEVEIDTVVVEWKGVQEVIIVV